MRRRMLVMLVILGAIVAGCGTATLLPDGRVLFLNGISKLYDPVAGELGNGSLPPIGRLLGTATLLQDGKVLVAGGSTNNKTVASADLYDPATDTYTPTGAMAHPRAAQTATLLSDGRVLMVGGGKIDTDVSELDPSTNKVPDPELYDPATGTFGPAATTLTPRLLHTATLLNDGKVLIAGGIGLPKKKGGDGVPLSSAELYDPGTNTWTATGDMSIARAYQSATLLADGRVLILGGASQNDALNDSKVKDKAATSAEIYDPSSGTFTPVTGALGAERIGATATLLDDGKVLVAGGVDRANTTAPFMVSAELFDPAAGTFTPTGDMTAGLAFQSAARLTDGKVILAGLGYPALQTMLSSGSSTATGDFLSDAQLYDPAVGTFSAVTVEPAVLPTPCPTKKDGSCKGK